MRGFLLLLSTALLAQVTPTPKPPAQRSASKPAAAKPATAAKTTSTAAKPAPAKPKPATPAPMTDEQKTIYALGLSISHSIAQFDLSPTELELVRQALADDATGKPEVEIGLWGPKIQMLAQGRAQRVAEREKVASAAYLTKVASEPGVVKTDSGLLYRETAAGSGPSPKATDRVKVNYRGTLTNGKEFDSSYARNEPMEFALNQVIPCWTEGVQKMKVGGKATLVCPAQIAYGDRGQSGIPGGATLTFEIELLQIVGGGTP